MCFVNQDLKYGSGFSAEFFNIEAADFTLEPTAVLTSSGRGYLTGGPGDGALFGTGGSHASRGGHGEFKHQ